jgi:hypothetical protein
MFGMTEALQTSADVRTDDNFGRMAEIWRHGRAQNLTLRPKPIIKRLETGTLS